MKRFLLYLFAVTTLVACTKGDDGESPNPNPDPTPSKPKTEIKIETTASDFTAEGGKNKISFTASEAWSAEVINSRADGWCSISPTSGAAGSATITVTTEPNDTPDDRSASIVIKAGSASKTVKVSQKQKDALTVTASSFEVGAEGGEVKIEVKANVNFEYAIEDSAKDWVEYKGTRAMKTSTLTFSVAENDDTKKREAKIYITSGEFNEEITIYQDGTEPSIVISQNEYIVSSDGETIAVEVASNVDVAVELPTNVDWISENTTRGISTNTYYIDIAPSEEYDQRSAEIKFTNSESGLSELVKVVQAQKDALVLAKDSYTVESEGGQIEIEVGHNVDFDVEIFADWITQVQTRAFTTETLVFNVAKNPSNDNREGTITFKSKDGGLSQTVKVYQAQEDALILSKKDIVVGAESGTVSFEIHANVEFAVNEPNVSWLRAVQTRGLATHTLLYEYDANTAYDSREAQIVVTNTKTNESETITITQAQKDAIVLAKDSYTVESEGGQIEIEVGHNVDFDVEISTDWITRVQTRAFTTETLVFNIAKNPFNDNREGTITFKSKDGGLSQTVKVYQAQEDALIISKKDIVVSADSGTVSFEIQANVDFTVSEPNVSWLRAVQTRGLATHTLLYEYDANTSYDSREAQIVVTNTKTNESETITITQAQKDAIVLAKSEYEFGVDGGNLDFEIQTNVDVTVTISDDAKDWIQQVETRALESKTLYFNVSACSADEDREGTITISGGNATQTITVKQSGLKEILEKEREALIAFYNATGGDNWTRNDNWCSDKPIEEWYGIQTGSWPSEASFRKLYSIILDENNLTGAITNELDSLSYLKFISISRNNLTFVNIDACQELNSIECSDNNITNINIRNCPQFNGLGCNDNKLSKLDVSHLPDLQTLSCMNNNISLLNISNCAKLFSLSCGGNPITKLDLKNNPELDYLQGYGNPISSIDLSNCQKLRVLYLGGNPLSSLEVSNCYALEHLSCDYCNLTNLDISHNPRLTQLSCENNNLISLKINNPKLQNLFCRNNNLTELDLSQSPELCQLICGYNKITTLDLCNNPELVTLWCNENNLTLLDVKKCLKLENLLCHSNSLTSIDVSNNVALQELWVQEMLLQELDVSYNMDMKFLFCINNPNLTKIYVDPNQVFEYTKDDIARFYYKDGSEGEISSPLYESTDYSKDGEVKTLQTAAEGNGIDIVLMGDGYSDRLISDGTYDSVMNIAMEKFFMEEPYKSHRDHFNVYSVTSVSKNEVYTNTSETAFAGYFGEETLVGGNDARVFSYAEKAIGAERMDDALIVVMMNSEAYAGTCYMYHPSDGDWSNGVSISYFPVGQDDTALAQVLHHEAAGHGFSKLGDEYAYLEMGNVPEWEVESAQTMATYGWWKNIDFTNDPAKIKWSHFLSDNRYAGDGLGVYEGAFTYWTGVWRPTKNSIMRYNTGGFNAPSREAIYYRIHKLAYGADWEYDYEEFVEWDARNRSTASATRGVPYRMEEPKDFKPLHAPVVMKTSWRNAKNNAPAKKPVTPSSYTGNAGRNLQKASLPSMATASKSMTATKTITLPDGTTRTITTSASGATQTTYSNNAKK